MIIECHYLKIAKQNCTAEHGKSIEKYAVIYAVGPFDFIGVH